MANRQIARVLKCSPATADRLNGHVGRHCLLFQRHHLASASPFRDIVIDGFRSFEYSQFYPFEHLLAVDNASSFVIHHTDAPLRRSGRMTAGQKKRRRELESIHGRPDPKAVKFGARELLEVSLAGVTDAIVHSDEHRAYEWAVGRVLSRIEHRQTSSRRRRDRCNELFEINSLDVFLRHSHANHRRETIAFSKRRQESAYRLSSFLVWKNFVKRRWEKKCDRTPAMIVGLASEVLTADDVMSRRLFVGHYELPASWERYYWRQVETPVLGNNRRHRRKFAF